MVSGLAAETVFIEEKESLWGESKRLKVQERGGGKLGHRREERVSLGWEACEEELVWGEGCGFCLGPTGCEVSTGIQGRRPLVVRLQLS